MWFTDFYIRELSFYLQQSVFTKRLSLDADLFSFKRAPDRPAHRSATAAVAAAAITAVLMRGTSPVSGDEFDDCSRRFSARSSDSDAQSIGY